MKPLLAVAFDFESIDEARKLLALCPPKDVVIKIGKGMFTQYGPDWVKEVVAAGFRVFLDLKYHDIPNTVAHSCRVAAKLGVWMLNVHASGGTAMLQAAKQALVSCGLEKPPLLIGVTVLTSMAADDLSAVGVHASPLEQALLLAKLCDSCGLDGVVCSAQEVQAVKSHTRAGFLTVTPGIRLLTDKSADQKRILTPKKAIEMGSDVLVMGRSITQAINPQKVIAQIAEAL